MNISFTNTRINKTNLCLIIVLLSAFFVYLYRINYSGLWYDEAIEYFYSKNLTGLVPFGEGTTNMYQRIRLTFQPPLYNVLMHLWLQFFDSEFSYRLFGILVTLIGSIGIFKAVKVFAGDGIFPLLGTALYLLSDRVYYFGLECGEYSLMLCFLAWSIYYFVRIISKSTISNLIGFFVLSSLAVYSQYGAAFPVLIMASIVFFIIYRGSDTKAKQNLTVLLITTLLVAVIPLIVFFILPQVIHQGSAFVSHVPCFKYSFLTDFALSSKDVFLYFFPNKILPVDSLLILALIVISFAGVYVSKKKHLRCLFLVLLLSWVTVYFAVACSFYAYNGWKGVRGTENISDRYMLFLMPVIIVFISTGVKLFIDSIANHKYRWTITAVITCLCLCFIVFSLISINRGISVKSEMREVEQMWYESELRDDLTVIHNLDAAAFTYYLIHNPDYDESTNYNYLIYEHWINETDPSVIEDTFREAGILEADGFNYICSSEEITNERSAFMQMIANNGYDVRIIRTGEIYIVTLSK